MNAYRRSRGITTHSKSVLDGSEWSSSSSLCSGKMPVSNTQKARCASELALQFRKEKNLPLQGFKPQIIQCTAKPL
jgi:hypothetical protein